MNLEGGCYCGAVRYRIDGDAIFRGECFCRECQYISGGGSNIVIGIPEPAFAYTKGTPKGFSRADLETPVTREFCADCGTHILATSPGMAGVKILKVGTLDDPSVYGKGEMAIFTVDAQAYHRLPDDVPTFERAPG